MFDAQKCHLCSQSKPYEMCTCFLRHRGATIVPFEGNAAITITTPRQLREDTEEEGGEDSDPDCLTLDVTEFNISIQESRPVPSAESAEDSELIGKKQKFLLEASKCISDVGNLYDIGIRLGAEHKDIASIHTNNERHINLCAFQMLLFCYEKKKCTWQDFLSNLESAFQSIKMANELERLRNLWQTLIK